MSKGKVFTVQLITLIQTYPVLYDGLVEATKLQKSLAWQEIASLLQADVSFLRKRWEFLCLNFKKALEMNQTNWIYYKYMSWFLPSSRAAKSVDELEQFLDTLKPANFVPARNDINKTSFNQILANIKSEPEIELLPDNAEDDFGEFSREAEPEDYEETLPDDEANSVEPNTLYDDSIGDCQISTGGFTIEAKNDSSEPESETDIVLDRLIDSVKSLKCTSRGQLNMLIIRLVKAFPVLYTFPLLKSKWSERSLLFKKIANQVRRFCTCRHEHITTQFIRQRWLTLSAHFRKDNFNNKRFGTPFGKWKHCKALMFLQPYLNHEIEAKANSTVDPTNTNRGFQFCGYIFRIYG